MFGEMIKNDFCNLESKKYFYSRGAEAQPYMNGTLKKWEFVYYKYMMGVPYTFV